jgi:hypothetical protein
VAELPETLISWIHFGLGADGFVLPVVVALPELVVDWLLVDADPVEAGTDVVDVGPPAV